MNFPKFMIRQTGGLAVGAISTRSRLASFAFSSASAIGTTPSASPNSPMRRTSFHRICSLTRMFFLSILHLRDDLLRFSFDRLTRKSEKLFHGHRPGVAAVPQPHRNRACRHFFLSHDEHRGRLLELSLPDARAELLVALVHLDAKAGRGELRGDLARPLRKSVRDGQADRLSRRDPERKISRRVLDQDPDEAFERPEDRPVHDDRPVLLAVLADVGQVEAL